MAKAATDIADRAKKELKAAGLEMQLTGRVSERARKELQALGWALEERVPGGSPSGN